MLLNVRYKGGGPKVIYAKRFERWYHEHRLEV